MTPIRTHTTPNTTPRTRPVTCIVVHATVGGLHGSLSWLCNPASQVSAEYVISRDGDVYQLVPDVSAVYCWHTGDSQWRGLAVMVRNKRGRIVPTLNPVSIGIELENRSGMRIKHPDGTASIHPPEAYPDEQLAALTELVRELRQRYAVRVEDVIRHLDCAIPRGRKNDPAGMAWTAWKAGL